MNVAIYLFGSGIAFFAGIGISIFAVVARQSKSKINRVGMPSFLIGGILLAVSATPLSNAEWIGLAIAAVVWLAAAGHQKYGRAVGFAMFFFLTFAALTELPYHLRPNVASQNASSLLVIGDSVTAGTGIGDATIKWPDQIEKDHGVEVVNLAIPGAQASTALKELKHQSEHHDMAIVEIGGNDLMGSTTNHAFENDLDTLLALLSTRVKQVIMFELPLPPFRNEYGRIQRRLSKKYNVMLIPKREFAALIAHPDNTSDSIHLTQAGHDRMGKLVWQIIGPAFFKP